MMSALRFAAGALLVWVGLPGAGLALELNESLNLGLLPNGSGSAQELHIGFVTSSTTQFSKFDAYLLRDAGPDGKLEFLNEGNGPMILGTTGTGVLKLGTNHLDRLLLNSDGSVVVPGSVHVTGVVATGAGIQAGQFLTVGSADVPTVYLDLGSMPNDKGKDRDIYVGFAASAKASSNSGEKLYDAFLMRGKGEDGYFYALNSGNGRFTLGNSGTGPIVLTANQQDRLVIHPSGQITIGTPIPRGLLSVGGEVVAKKVTVTANGWADNVFHPDYALPSLPELAAQIKAQGHLPGMPSEAEILKEGVSVADMARLHQQKIEELTLYVIQQEARVKQQADEIAELKALVRTLVARSAP